MTMTVHERLGSACTWRAGVLLGDVDGPIDNAVVAVGHHSGDAMRAAVEEHWRYCAGGAVDHGYPTVGDVRLGWVVLAGDSDEPDLLDVAEGTANAVAVTWWVPA